MIKFPEDFKVVCLHLAERTDRLPNIERMRQMFGDVEVIEGYTPENVPIPSPFPGQPASKWACGQSKKKMIEQALRSGKKYILHLEDDCVLAEDALEQIQKTINAHPDFDAIYAGWFPLFGGYCDTHCLLMHADVAAEFVKELENPELYRRTTELERDKRGSSDVILLLFLKDRNMKVIAMSPQVAFQKGGRSDNCRGYYRDYPQWHPHYKPAKIKVCQYIVGDDYCNPDGWFYKYVKPINQLYCDTHGYDYVVDDYSTSPAGGTGEWSEDWQNRNAYWLKVPHIQRNLHHCDYLFFIDADIIFYNHLFKIEEDILEMMIEVNAAIMVTKDITAEMERWIDQYDKNSISAGQLLFKNDARSFAFLRDWNALTLQNDFEKWKNTWPNEQPCLTHICNNTHHKNHVKIVKEYYKMQGLWGYFLRHIHHGHHRLEHFYKFWNSPLMERNRQINKTLKES
jgi:hypothetical protein